MVVTYCFRHCSNLTRCFNCRGRACPCPARWEAGQGQALPLQGRGRAARLRFRSEDVLGFGRYGYAPGWSQALPGNRSLLGAHDSSLARDETG